MKLNLTLIFLLIINSGNYLPQNFNSLNLYNSYSSYKEESVSSKRFYHSDLKSKIQTLKKTNIFSVEIVGKSIEEREIYLLSIGSGKTNVLLWSQMHGDESTATMALLDLFNFFIDERGFDELKKELLNELTIYFIPMINPDGAELFKRRNALDIDLNRDALRLESPEAKILKDIRERIQPKFAFNLHDQNTRYTSGNSYRSATISFLAPAYNYEKDINDIRKNTMKLIVNLYNELNNYIPGHIAKYKDDFEPRAFGDNFIKWGTSSVLIESGGWKNDEEKQFIRKLNFLAILTGLNSIATNFYRYADVEIYHNIPFNDNLLFDLLLRNLKWKYGNKYYKIDIGINREEKLAKDLTRTYYSGEIVDWGDLSIYYGYDELNLEGYEVRESKIHYIDQNDLDTVDHNKIIKEGFGFIALDSININDDFSNCPLNIVSKEYDAILEPQYNSPANFTIWKDEELVYNVINGFLYDIKTKKDKFGNGLIFK